MSANPVIVWLRQDLRLTDNPAVDAACASGKPVVFCYIWAPDEEAPWPPGAASRWWLHHSLKSLQHTLEDHGQRLIIKVGSSIKQLVKLVKDTNAEAVYFNARYEPSRGHADRACLDVLRALDIQTKVFHGSVLFNPDSVGKADGSAYSVFTPFWNRVRLSLRDLPAPSEKIVKCPAPSHFPESAHLDELRFLPHIPWDTGMRLAWLPGEHGAQAHLKHFIDSAAEDYPEGRDIPGVQGVSMLSPHLHFGEISPRQILFAVQEAERNGLSQESAIGYTRQLVWREFAINLLFHNPDSAEHSMNPAFDIFEWNADPDALKAWQRGRTGYPIVDAGMRQLWRTGWMHNRVRMIVASFLVKDLLLPWQVGARWFWDTLVDADLANNTMGWQWVAGCGADPAPFFRIFNPFLQGQKFDPEGEYVRRWIPELRTIPNQFVHQPWLAPEPPKDYPAPIVDHAAARQRALAASEVLKRGSSAGSAARLKHAVRTQR